jgi:hypothetical protein
MFSPPHQRIAAASGSGSPLMLRLRSPTSGRRGHLWLRVHENGELAQVDGDARSEGPARLLAALGRADPRIVAAAAIRDHLRAKLERRDLTGTSPWDHFSPVQAFAGAEPVVEGFIGIEIDMGVRTDVFGFDNDRARPDFVVDGINALLDFVRR